MKSLRQIDILGAALIAALVLTAFAGPIRAKMAERGTLVAQRESALLTLAERGTLEERLGRAEEEVTTLRENIEVLHRSFPPRKELDSFLSELNQLARSTDTELVRVVPGASREGDVFSMMAIQLEARGSFESFYHFLWGLDRMTRLSQVETLRLSHAAEGTCSAEMTLYIFVSARGQST